MPLKSTTFNTSYPNHIHFSKDEAPDLLIPSLPSSDLTPTSVNMAH